MMTYNIENHDYSRIESAIQFIDENFKEQPSLSEIADSVHLSKYHFQRLFKRWAGVTPGQFLHYLTVDYAKQRLRDSQSVLETALDAGLSGPGRLHDMFISFEAMTPGEYKKLGAGLEIRHGVHESPFGSCLLATTDRGICALRFLPADGDEANILAELAREWPRATFAHAPAETSALVRRIFSKKPDDSGPHRLLLKGTNFQVKVWQALLAIPAGGMVSYQDVATGMGASAATRAVAGAVAKNPVAYLIPCHRVISKAGKTHNYRWGDMRKKAMLGWEASRLPVAA
jgi:AraC family transcriptional regulator of adaptative response/methylated-DNA-[protein]-cysteine methyltransferase